MQFSLSPLSSPLIMVVHIEVNNLTRREHLNLGLSYNKYTKKSVWMSYVDQFGKVKKNAFIYFVVW